MIRVLVVDDSAVVRRVLSEGLGRYPDLQVVGHAQDPYVAREKIVALRPDVMTLDVEMPRMDGLSFLAKVMQHRPMPVVVVSSLTPRGGEEALRALALGAVEVICKPGSAYDVGDIAPRLAQAVRAAAAAKRIAPHVVFPPCGDKAPLAPLGRTSDHIIALGASTGGTEALRTVMAELPGDAPGTVIVQHMPPAFTTSFARSLDSISRMHVAEARGGERLQPGLAFLAPGNHHLVVVRSGAQYHLEVREGPQVHFQRPAVDVTFHSLAKAAGANCVAALMTGMGQDGAAGLKALRDAGAHTICQDEASSVVWGMPKAGIDCGAACDVAPLEQIAARLVTWSRRAGALTAPPADAGRMP